MIPDNFNELLYDALQKQKAETMTDREAIEVFKGHNETLMEMLTKPIFDKAHETINRHIEANNIAIKALEEKIRMEDDGK